MGCSTLSAHWVHTPAGHQHQKGRDKPAGADPRQGDRDPSQASLENRTYISMGKRFIWRLLYTLTLRFLLPKERLGDFSKQTLGWVGGTQLWSHHTAAGRELLGCVTLQRGHSRGLISITHMKQLSWADRSPPDSSLHFRPALALGLALGISSMGYPVG